MTERREFVASLTGAALTVLGTEGRMMAQVAAEQTAPKPREAARLPLPDPFTGWEARFVEVTFPAGVASAPHRHPGFVLGYVLEGEFRFAINGEPPRDLHSGQAFYEPPGALHTIGASALPDKPAKILAIIIAPRGNA